MNAYMDFFWRGSSVGDGSESSVPDTNLVPAQPVYQVRAGRLETNELWLSSVK